MRFGHINNLLSSQSRTARAIIAALAAVLSIAADFLLYPSLGVISGVFLVLPVIAFAWYFGAAAAALSVAAGIGVNILAGYLSSPGTWSAYLLEANLTGGVAALLVGLIIAGFRRINLEHRREIVERQNAEGEHRAYAGFLSLLNDIVRASLETEDLPTLLKLLAERTGGLFAADDCFITLWNEATQTTVPSAAYGPMSRSYDEVPARPGQRTLTSSALAAGHALVVEDTADTPYVDRDVAIPFPELRTALGLPLISGERKLGAVILGFHKKRAFTPEEIEQGELAARQISLAMMKVILLAETRQRLDEIAGLHAISQTFTLDDPGRTFGLLTGIVAHLFGAGICVVLLRDPSVDELRGQPSGFGLDEESIAGFHFPIAQALEIWDFTRQSIFCAHSLQEVPTPFQAMAQASGLENILAAPLWSRDRELIGILIAANKGAGFDDDDLRLMEILAGQVAVVVENTRLLSAERRRSEELSVLNAISIAATEAGDEDELIERATRLIGMRLYPDNFGILLLDDEKGELYLHSSYRLGESESPVRIPLGEGITGSVARSGRLRYVSDIRTAPDYVSTDERILSELCAPLKIGERVLGVVNAESARVNAFTKDDENLLGILASQLAAAIQRLRTAKAEYYQTTQLMRANALIRILAQVGARASAASDPAGVMKTLGDELTKIGLTCLVALPRDEQTMFIAYTSIPRRVVALIERVSKRTMTDFLIPSERLMVYSGESPQPILLHDPIASASNILMDFPRSAVEKILRPIGVTDDIPLCHLPLVSEGKLQGILWLWGEGLRESDLPAMSIFASQAAIALQNSRLLAEVQRMAITDEGTGIFNRRHFFQLAEQEFSQARRYKQPLTAVIADVDEFKAFNDRYGHVIGDQVLRQVAQALKNNLRDGDVLGRYGGEEFSILLPFTNLDTARQVAERLRERVAAAGVKTDTGLLAVTVSVGLAEFDPKMDRLLALVELADQAMYDAKAAGGNRVSSRPI
ncbi:MAG: diguanylate cyclase [Anaerolineaceae bacterium]|nr:MAG: diguanylate cyclase [Anaerolineaceae bacterium]